MLTANIRDTLFSEFAAYIADYVLIAGKQLVHSFLSQVARALESSLQSMQSIDTGAKLPFLGRRVMALQQDTGRVPEARL